MFSGIPIDEITSDEALADGQKVKPLALWYLIVKNNEVVYRSTNKLKRSRKYQKEFFREPGVYLQEYQTTEEDVQRSKELKRWNNGFTHSSLDFEKQERELSYFEGDIIWPWEADDREGREKKEMVDDYLNFMGDLCKTL